MHINSCISILIIVVTIVGVALGRFPFLRMNRATIAFVGTVLLIVTGAISTEQAYGAIDFNTIVLLFSIMVLNVNFRLSGFFYLVTKFIVSAAKTPRQLLGLLIVFSGLLSALFLNDTIVLVFTPITIEITRILKRNPIPYLIALATSANIGSVATFIGNPQNILIGTSSGISFVEFAMYLTPIAVTGLVVVWILITSLYKIEFKNIVFDSVSLPKFRLYRPLLKKSILSASLMIIALFAGVPTSIAAMGAAALLLITRRLKAERVFAEIDWSLLVFFAGLFVVTSSVETMGKTHLIKDLLRFNAGNELLNLTIISTVLSNLISNVPAVLLLRNLMESFVNVKMAWLTMAMATTFAGNLTLLGSVANLIVAESAKKRGIILNFKEYLKAGIPITITSLLFGLFWLGLFA